MRPVRHEVNQERDVLVIPIEDSLWRRVLREMVSKAAVTSRRMRSDSEPESAAMKRPLVIFMSVVSVLWRG